MRYFSSAPSITFNFVCQYSLSVTTLRNEYFVQLLVKVLELGRLGHDVFVHEEGRLNGCIVALGEEIESVLDEGEIQSDTIVCEKVSSVADDFDTAGLLVESVYPRENLVVGDDIFAFNRRLAVWIPPFEELIIVLGID